MTFQQRITYPQLMPTLPSGGQPVRAIGPTALDMTFFWLFQFGDHIQPAADI
jgi:hypothetical protein